MMHSFLCFVLWMRRALFLECCEGVEVHIAVEVFTRANVLV